MNIDYLSSDTVAYLEMTWVALRLRNIFPEHHVLPSIPSGPTARGWAELCPVVVSSQIVEMLTDSLGRPAAQCGLQPGTLISPNVKYDL